MPKVKVISWNIARQDEPWRQLRASGADVALLQEAAAPPSGLDLEVDDAAWETAGEGQNRPWRTAIVRLSDRVRVTWMRTRSLDEATSDDLPVSRLGTLAAAAVEELTTGRTITLVSMYGAWERPLPASGSSWIYADASVHRLVSDLSCLIGRQAGHEIVAAGDLNVLNRYGEGGSPYWAARYSTVFDRFDALGLRFVGPQHPNGLRATPRPAELPEASGDVPTFRTRRNTPATATRQLDFVFASRALDGRITVSALNSPDEWGPSDHCRIAIELS